MGDWPNQPERERPDPRDAPERRRPRTPYGDAEQFAPPLRRPPRSPSATDDGQRRTGGRPPVARSAPYPPYQPSGERTPAALSRPLRPGPPLANRPGAGSPLSSEPPRPAWRRWLPIMSGLVAGVVLVAIVLAVLLLLRGQQPAATSTATLPAPTPTAQSLCADLLAQRYTAAYVLLTPQLRQQGTEAQYVASQRELDALQGRVTACIAGKLAITTTNATGALTITRAHTSMKQAALSLAWNGSAWQISAYDTSVV